MDYLQFLLARWNVMKLATSSDHSFIGYATYHLHLYFGTTTEKGQNDLLQTAPKHRSGHYKSSSDRNKSKHYATTMVCEKKLYVETFTIIGGGAYGGDRVS